jgi:siroheme synthase-like protein
MTPYLPICLDLRGRRALVVGGGSIATERALDLERCGATVTVVSPAPGADLRAAAAEGRVTLLDRPWRPGDTEEAFVVAVATEDPAVSAAVYAEASAAGRLVNVCDDPEHCTFIFPARVERGPLTVSVFTHGTSPALSRRVRREMEMWLGPEYAALAELLADLRPRVRALPGWTQERRQAFYERLVYGEALQLFREGRGEEARALAERLLAGEGEREP